jgi:O-antigen ligase
MLTKEPEGALESLRAGIALLALPLALFAWLAPNHYFPWPAFHGQASMVVAALLMMLWLMTSRRAAPQRLHWFVTLLVLAAVIPWLQWAVGIIHFSGDALMSSLFLIGFAASIMLGQRMTDTFGLQALMQWLSWLFIAGSMLCVGMALYQWQHLDYLFIFVLDIAPGARPVANFAQPNLLATMLVLGLVGCAYVYHLGRLSAATAGMLAVYLLFGIVMTQSRAALLELLVVGAWLCWRARDSKVKPSVVALALAVTAVLTVAWPHLASSGGAGDGRGAHETTSAGTRPTHWRSMLDAIRHEPWVGYGWNQTTVAHYAVAPDHEYTGEVLGSSHNLLLDLLVWNGVPLGLLLAAGLVVWFGATLRQKMTPEAAFAMSVVLALFAHSMVEFPIHFFFFLIPLGVLMGGLSAMHPPSASKRLPRSAAPLVLAALVVVAGSVIVEYLAIERQTFAKRFENARIGLDKPREPTEAVRLITQEREFLRFVSARDRDNMPREEVEWMGRIAQRYPNWTSITRYAAALARNGQPEAARAALTRICKIQVPDDCERAQVRWRTLGEDVASIRAVTFPAPKARAASEQH